MKEKELVGSKMVKKMKSGCSPSSPPPRGDRRIWDMRGPSSSGERIGGQGVGENGISYLPGKRAYVCVSWMEPHCKSTRNNHPKSSFCQKNYIIFCVFMGKAHSLRFACIESALSIHRAKGT